jgi:hypothetical protein
MIRTLGASRISHKLQFARESVVRFGGLGPVGIGVAGDPGSDELSSVDVATDGWDIRARWFGVICVTPRLGVPDRGITIAWRVTAAQITAQWPAAALTRPKVVRRAVVTGTRCWLWCSWHWEEIGFESNAGPFRPCQCAAARRMMRQPIWPCGTPACQAAVLADMFMPRR